MSRKLDIAIAEALGKCVEWKLTCYSLRMLKYTDADGPFINPDPGGAHQCVCPHYSTDGNAMLELSREMRARGWLLRLYAYMGYFSANFFGVTEDMRYIRNNAKADALPEAVALAAYKALTGGKEWSE